MTVKPTRLFCLLMLSLAVVDAACALQKPAVTPAPLGGKPSEVVQKRPEGPQYVAPQLAIGQGGRLYLLWLTADWEKGSWDILFSRSEDGGATWSQPPLSLKSDKATAAGGIQIVSGPSGNVYAVWRESDPKTKNRRLRFIHSQDNGVHWNETPLPSVSGEVGLPRLLADQDGGVVVTFLAGPASYRELLVANSRDFGATFTSMPTRLTPVFTTSEGGITNPRSASDAEGRLYVVWQEYKTSSDSLIHLGRSLDRGKTWIGQPTLLNAPVEGNGYRGFMPRVTTAPQGRVYVVWEQEEYREGSQAQLSAVEHFDRFLYVNRSLDDGHTWLPKPIRLSEMGSDPAVPWSPQLTGDQHGNVYAVWTEIEGVYPKRLFFARSTDSGASWSAPKVRLDLSSSFGGRPVDVQIRNDNAGHVWVLWQEPTRGRRGWQIMMNRSDDGGKTWLEQATVLPGSHQQVETVRVLSFQSDAHGHLYVAWNGGSQGVQAIFFARSTDFGATWLSYEVQVGRR